MRHEHAERAVKSLQKSFLYWIEDDEGLSSLGANDFNRLRTEVFKSTFSAFRLGVVGVDPNDKEEREEAWDIFLKDYNLPLDEQAHWELITRFLGVLLVCFRLGSAVALGD